MSHGSIFNWEHTIVHIRWHFSHLKKTAEAQLRMLEVPMFEMLKQRQILTLAITIALAMNE